MNTQTLFGNCIHCAGTVRIPVGASPAAEVKCPRCGETFQLGTILDQAAPPLEIMGMPAPIEVVAQVDRVLLEPDEDIEIEEKQQRKFEVPEALRKGAQRKKRRRSRSSGSGSGSGSSSSRNGESRGRDGRGSSRSRSSSRSSSSSPNSGSPAPIEANDLPGTEMNGISVETETAPSAGPANVAVREERSSQQSSSNRSRGGESRSRSRSRSRKKKSGSGIGEVLKIAIGAALAIPMSQLVLFWFLNFDPLNVAPMVEKVIPALVPHDLRAERSDNPETPNDAFNAKAPKNSPLRSSDFESGGLNTPRTDPSKLLRPRN